MNRPVTRHTKLAHAVDITAAVRIADNRRILHHYPVSSPVMRKRHARRASCHDRRQSHHRRYFSYIFPHADYLRFRNVHAKISSRFRAYIQIDFLFHNKYARKAAILSFFYKIQKYFTRYRYDTFPGRDRCRSRSFVDKHHRLIVSQRSCKHAAAHGFSSPVTTAVPHCLPACERQV